MGIFSLKQIKYIVPLNSAYLISPGTKFQLTDNLEAFRSNLPKKGISSLKQIK